MYSLIALRCPEDSGTGAFGDAKNARAAAPFLPVYGGNIAVGIQLDSCNSSEIRRVGLAMNASPCCGSAKNCIPGAFGDAKNTRAAAPLLPVYGGNIAASIELDSSDSGEGG
jgi:hypothetical protein